MEAEVGSLAAVNFTRRGEGHAVISNIGSGVGIKTRPRGLLHASITAALDA